MNSKCIFPNLEKTFSNIKSGNDYHDYICIIKSKLRYYLKQDLTENQYKIIIQETISEVKTFLKKHNFDPISIGTLLV